jgi:hypothetical protein
MLQSFTTRFCHAEGREGVVCLLECVLTPAARCVWRMRPALCLCARQTPDMESAFQFRQDMYEYMNVSLPRTPPRNILLFMRQDKYVGCFHAAWCC